MRVTEEQVQQAYAAAHADHASTGNTCRTSLDDYALRLALALEEQRTAPVLTKADAAIITGGVTQTSKMPCQSYSLPTIACQTGFRMAQVEGSICSSCYANKGNYLKYANNVEPAQHARLESVTMAIENEDGARALWISAMVALIGKDEFFRWHDSGDLQSVEHLELIADVARATPHCSHWLPTREYGMVAAYVAQQDLPANLTVRLSAMFAGKPVKVPASLQGVAGVAVSNVHTKGQAPLGQMCAAYTQQGKCGDCRACWSADTAVSYPLH